MKLVFPLPPNRANARGHWRVRYHGQKRYWETLDRLQLLGRIPPPPAEPYYKVMAINPGRRIQQTKPFKRLLFELRSEGGPCTWRVEA